MTIRKILISVAALSAVVPAFANAAEHESMAQACGHAFAAKLGLAGGESQNYKLTDLAFDNAGSLEKFYATDYTVDLVARAPKTGALLAKATCLVSRGGTVLSLSAQPVAAGEARIAAKN
jgi:hypothetical protein